MCSALCKALWFLLSQTEGVTVLLYLQCSPCLIFPGFQTLGSVVCEMFTLLAAHIADPVGLLMGDGFLYRGLRPLTALQGEAGFRGASCGGPEGGYPHTPPALKCSETSGSYVFMQPAIQWNGKVVLVFNAPWRTDVMPDSSG